MPTGSLSLRSAVQQEETTIR
jgi:hypothetical protein